MFRFLAKSAAVMAAVVLWAAPARASFVEYTIVGQFRLPADVIANNPPTAGLQNDGTFFINNNVGTTSTVTRGTSTLTFNFDHLGTFGNLTYHENFVLGLTSADFGYFTTASTASLGSPDSFTGVGFSLTITQTFPSGAGTLSTTISGVLASNGSNIFVSFIPPSVVIPSPIGNVYVLNPTNVSMPGVTTELTGNITEGPDGGQNDAPLPAVAPAALLLLGGFGLKRKRASVAA